MSINHYFVLIQGTFEHHSSRETAQLYIQRIKSPILITPIWFPLLWDFALSECRLEFLNKPYDVQSLIDDTEFF